MYESQNDKPQTTTALARLVDKAKAPADEFLAAIGTILRAGQYQLGAYGVDSEGQWADRESATIKLDEKTTLTIQLTRSK
jgi:hypothetical protein